MKLHSLIKTLGPGILFASTAIGVSHLVQSTTAGARFGFAMLWAVVIANLLKYPFFEFGSRYANATGTSIIDGYRKLGRPFFALYGLVTLVSMFFVCGAVGAVTVGFMQNLFGTHSWDQSGLWTMIILFGICLAILARGGFSSLDKLIKVVGAVMLVTTLITFTAAMFRGPESPMVFDTLTDLSLDENGWAFLIPLMGWMPTAVDLSTWNSLWTVEKMKSSRYTPSLKETLFEFNLGYWISAGLAICFLTLGAYMLYDTPIQLEKNGAAFSNQVVGIYTDAIGGWSYWIIAAAAFSIMFGTCIAVFDGFGRAVERVAEISAPQNKLLSDYRFWLAILVVGSGVLITVLSGDGIALIVKLATIISFLVAPIIAVMNYVLVIRKDFPSEARPGIVMHILSIAGILFLTGFSVWFLTTM